MSISNHSLSVNSVHPFCLDFEEKRSYGFGEKFFDSLCIPSFSIKEEANKYNFFKSFDNTVINYEDNFDFTNDFIGRLAEEDDSCYKFIMHEVPIEVSSNKEGVFLSESNCANSEIIIEISNSTIKNGVTVFDVNYLSHYQIFEAGKFDDYSWKIIKNILDEMNVLKKKDKKKKKTILIRKENADNLYKKIKGKFFKSLKNIINQHLKEEGSKKFFHFFPPYFTNKITKEETKAIFDLNLKDIYSGNFNYNEKDKKLQKLIRHNKNVLQYLENDINISEKSKFNIMKNMKLSQIYKQYLKSKAFGNTISSLKQENQKYIKSYIIKAYDFLKIIEKY